MHPNVENVAGALAAVGATGQVVELADAVRTAAAAAAALGVEVGAIANSLVFEADGAPLLVLASGGHRVDVATIAALLEVADIRLATPDFVRAAAGQPIGGVAPVGHPRRLRTVVDVALAGYDEVWAAAGHPHAVFPTSYEELLRITGGVPAEI